jgi:tripartite-type tricarboxylate transporter receptor subunit TctC
MLEKKKRRRTMRMMAGLVASTLIGPMALAQPGAHAYPAKPVTVLVGFTAGGPVDTTTRTVGEWLSRKWGQPVIVDVRPGANGTVAASMAAKAPADGYTLVMATRSITMNAALYTRLPYDPGKSFIPIAIAAAQPSVLVVSKDFPVKSSADLLQKIKARPGQYSYASTGNGSIPHLAGEMFQAITGTKVNHIPYKGGASLIIDLMAGRVDMSFGGLGTVIGQIRDGHVVPIAVASDQRSPLIPDVPTFAEAGVKGFNVDTWYGLLAPAGTPPAIIARINADVNEALSAPEVRQKLLQAGSSVQQVSPEVYLAQYKDDLRRYGKLIKELGLQLD